MNARSATRISWLLIGAAVVMLGTELVLAITVLPDVRPRTIIVVPADRAPSIEREAASLAADPDAATDPALGDAPAVLNDKREDLAAGDPLRYDISSGTAILFTLVIALWLGTGGLIVSRQPRNLAGWVFLVVGVAIPLGIVCQALVVAGTKSSAPIPFVPLWATVGEHAFFPPAVLVPLLWLLFPDGQPPSPRWRWVLRGLPIAIGLSIVSFALTPGPLNNYVDAGIIYMNPLGVPALATIGPQITGLGGFAALVVSIATIVGVRGRFKRSSGDERQQLRWLVFVTTLAAGLFLLIVAIGTIGETFLGASGEPRIGSIDVFNVLFGLLALVLILGVPAAYLVAIYRYHVWDLDVVIRKTVIFALVAGGMTLVALLLLILPLAALNTGLSVWERGLLLVGVVIGLLVGPFRRVARRLADRLVYGKRATPYEVLTQFSGRLGEAYAAEDVLQRMAQIVANGTAAASARVLLRVGGELREAAAYGAASGREHLVPVVHQGDELGAIAISMPANDPLDPSRERLVHDLASQAGLVLRNARLIEDLRASRQRLVSAQDGERRKIERNLHDGAQQQLVALVVQLGLAEQMAGDDPEKERALLARLGTQAQAALEDLRDLARGIYPPLLADKGLTAALQAQARKAAVPVTIESDGVGRFAQDVEATVYFCALEALNNVAKYADATGATVRLADGTGELRFEVTDDGRGFDPATTRYGTGLQGMADRLAAIGGSLEIRSAPGVGTTLLGTIPVPVNGSPSA